MGESDGFPDDKATGREGSVQSVDRAMRILEIIGASEAGCRLGEIARAAGLAPSTAHRLLTTLEKGRYVHASGGLWHVGLPLLSIGLAFLDRSSFVGLALPPMRWLRDETKETVNLGVAYDGEIVILAQVASRQIMRAVSRIGGRVPMASSAMGKAILATYPQDDVDHLARMGRRWRHRASAAGGSDLACVELGTIRDQGYAVDDEAVRKGLRCIAAVVYGQDGDVLCAISLSGLSERLSRDRTEMLAAKVQATAQAITRAVGGASVNEQQSQVPP